MLPLGKVLVTGGYNDLSQFINSAELCHPSSGMWTTTNTLTTARQYHTATLLTNGSVLVTGGYNGVYLNSAELYPLI